MISTSDPLGSSSEVPKIVPPSNHISSQGLLSHLFSLEGPAGFRSSDTAERVIEALGLKCQGTKTILITGATSPIGRAICKALSQQDVHLVLACHCEAEGAKLAKELLAGVPTAATGTTAAELLPEASSNEVQMAQKISGEASENTTEDNTTCLPQATPVKCQVTVLPCDLSTMKSAAKAAADFQALHLPLHTLILGAAIANGAFKLTDEGYEQQFSTNYLSQCVLAQALLPLLCTTAQHAVQKDTSIDESLKDTVTTEPDISAVDTEGGNLRVSNSSQSIQNDFATPVVPLQHQGMQTGTASQYGRIIFVSCSAHYLSYSYLRGGRSPGTWKSMVWGAQAARTFMPTQGFGLSKLAQILYAFELASRLEQTGAPILVHAVHPGITEHGIERFGGLEQGSWLQTIQSYVAGGLRRMGVLKSPEQAAASILYAALAPPSHFAIMRDRPDPVNMASDENKSASSYSSPTSPYPVFHCPQQQELAKLGQDVHQCIVHPHLPMSDKMIAKTEGVATDSNGSGVVSVSGRYIEDCRLSRPSPDARDPVAAAALWQATQEIIAGCLC